jgi:hypothetical protein
MSPDDSDMMDLLDSSDLNFAQRWGLYLLNCFALHGYCAGAQISDFVTRGRILTVVHSSEDRLGPVKREMPLDGH